jgi:hypothetical protein
MRPTPPVNVLNSYEQLSSQYHYINWTSLSAFRNETRMQITLSSDLDHTCYWSDVKFMDDVMEQRLYFAA